MRLYQLFYVTALIATAVNLWGLIGIAVGCVIAGAWYYVSLGENPQRRYRVLEVMLVATILFLFTCCLFPGVSHPRSAARTTQCRNCVKNIALALLNYESVWKQLPPAVTYDAGGRPMHSWRVLILPYIEEDKLYQRYSFDEPWNGPNNSKLLSQMPLTFRCPSLQDRSGTDFKTGYRVLLGERTCFPPDRSRKLSEIRDGMANTLLLVESNQPVLWMAPSEPTVQEYFREMQRWSHVNTPHHIETLLESYDYGGTYAMVDAMTYLVNATTDERVFEKIANVDDGALTESELEMLQIHRAGPRPRWQGYFAILAFLFFAGLPAFWLFPSNKHLAQHA
ncbi:MAG: DUF1559 domain-containing protein [Pirellulaceae bacterium]|nr:DUF1559 domain-containing protein [Pirellulaceae bacterium]